MSDERRRILLLCEDRRTELFVIRLCDRYSVRIADSRVAPSGKGDASEWVKRQYPGLVRKRRSKNFQRNLGLLVVIDGDDHGVSSRKRQLDAELSAVGVQSRAHDDSIAVFVPTWSVETWLALLCGRAGVDEQSPLKDDPRFRELWRDPSSEARTAREASASWKSSITPLPSLEDGYVEALRVGLA